MALAVAPAITAACSGSGMHAAGGSSGLCLLSASSASRVVATKVNPETPTASGCTYAEPGGGAVELFITTVTAKQPGSACSYDPQVTKEETIRGGCVLEPIAPGGGGHIGATVTLARNGQVVQFLTQNAPGDVSAVQARLRTAALAVMTRVGVAADSSGATPAVSASEVPASARSSPMSTVVTASPSRDLATNGPLPDATIGAYSIYAHADVGAGVTSVAIDGDGNVWMSDSGSQSAYRVDGTTGQPLANPAERVAGLAGPIAVDGLHNDVYVTAPSDAYLVRFSLNDMRTSGAQLASAPQHLVVEAETSKVIADNALAGQVTVLSASSGDLTVAGTTSVAGAGGLAVDTLSHQVFVAVAVSSKIDLVDEKSVSVVGWLPVPNSGEIAFDASADTLVVADLANNKVRLVRVAAQTGVAELSLDSVEGIAVDSPRGLAYAASYITGKLYVIDVATKTVVQTLTFPPGAAGAIADDSGHNRVAILVASKTETQLYLMSTT